MANPSGRPSIDRTAWYQVRLRLQSGDQAAGGATSVPAALKGGCHEASKLAEHERAGGAVEVLDMRGNLIMGVSITSLAGAFGTHC